MKSMKTVKTNRSPIEEIPPEVMLGILSRLVTKTCLNCKLVCKNWYRMIISQEFADLRSSTTRSCSTTILVHTPFQVGKKERTDFLLIDLDKPCKVDEDGSLIVSNNDAVIRFKSKLNDLSHSNLSVVNECDGVICLACRKWKPYVICNLLTGEQVVVKQQWRESCVGTSIYGIGCCPVSRQYKVVRVLCMSTTTSDNNKKSVKYKFVAEIQTVGTGEWRRVIDDVPNKSSLMYCDHLPKAFLHGSLHVYYSPDKPCYIWSFNFETEQFSRLPTPVQIHGWRAKQSSFVSVFDSCLCFTTYDDESNQCVIWLMKKYGDKASWIRQFVIQPLDHWLNLPLLRMSTGEILVSGWRTLQSYLEAPSRGKNVNFQGGFLFRSLTHFNPKFSKINAATPVEVKLKRRCTLRTQ